MQILIYQDKHKMGSAMAERGAALIQQAIAQDGHAFIILATGASQFELLAALITKPDIDWSKVTAFHLDEYVGLPATHKASFRQYLQVKKLPCVLPELGKMRILRLMIPPLISKRARPIILLIWMTLAAVSNWAKDGFQRLRMFRAKLFRCRSGRCWRLSVWC